MERMNTWINVVKRLVIFVVSKENDNVIILKQRFKNIFCKNFSFSGEPTTTPQPTTAPEPTTVAGFHSISGDFLLMIKDCINNHRNFCYSM